MKRLSLLLSFLIALTLIGLEPATAGPAASVEKGHDVGDGIVPLNSPYNPKSVSEVTFVSPTAEYPFFEIAVPLGDWDGGTGAKVETIEVNGAACEAFNLFVDGFSHVSSNWLTNKAATAENVVVVARSLWHNSEKTDVKIVLKGTDSEGNSNEVVREFSATAPKKGGGPVGWRRAQSFTVREKTGLPRENEPIEFSIAARAENCGDLEKELRVSEWNAETSKWIAAPFQTFNKRVFHGTPRGTTNENYLQHPSQTIEVVTPVTLDANASKAYAVFYDNPDASAVAAPETDLVVSGPSLGATIENWFFTTRLSEKNGQIASLDLKPQNWSSRVQLGAEDFSTEKNGDPEWEGGAVPRLTNSYSYAVHWNPDSFSDNGKWGHTFSWDPPDRTEVVTRGPLMFRITNSGRMPGYTPQVRVAVTYTFYAGVPYALSTTAMEVRDPLNTSAIRNGEIVLDSHLITHFVWEEKNGNLETVRTGHGPTWQDEWSHRIDHDAPWVAMTHELDGYGVGTAIVDSLAFNPLRGEGTRHRPAFYLYYHHFWSLPLTYFTRAWVYPFSDYQRGPIIPVEPGSTYLDRMAFIPFPLREGEGRYEEIEGVSARLLNPVEVRWGR